MIRAFITKVDIQDASTLADVAMDIDDALDKAGILVVSVVPWKGHGVMAQPVQPVVTGSPPPPPVL